VHAITRCTTGMERSFWSNQRLEALAL
jgi:hypothetical protein